ncbi:MAG: hypothetical protein ACRETL_06970 [Gammaproteobacteria bacterium]
MNRNTLFIVLGLGAAYFYLSSRQPVFQQLPDGTYQPAGLLDRLTVMLTGVRPPQPKSVSVNIPGLIDASYTA